jgi:hypothetical protein
MSKLLTSVLLILGLAFLRMMLPIEATNGQSETEKPEIGRYKIGQTTEGPILWDTSTGACWLYGVEEWIGFTSELPWKRAKPTWGRFQFFNPQGTNCILDTATGRTWQFRFETNQNGRGLVFEGNLVKVQWVEFSRSSLK